MHWYTHEFTFSESDCVLLIASISLDLAQKNLYAPLLTGGRLCLFPAGVNDYAGISETIEREQVTVINCAHSRIYPLITCMRLRKIKRISGIIFRVSALSIDCFWEANQSIY